MKAILISSEDVDREDTKSGEMWEILSPGAICATNFANGKVIRISISSPHFTPKDGVLRWIRSVFSALLPTHKIQAINKFTAALVALHLLVQVVHRKAPQDRHKLRNIRER